MAKANLSRETQGQLLQDFCEALASLRTSQEILPFLVDLLTKMELLTLTKRFQIAKLLLEDKDYRNIENNLHVSHGTIAKVAAWLEESGEGFRLVVERTKGVREKTMPSRNLSEWSKLKRRYPIAFWPQLLLEEIVRSATKEEKLRLNRTIEKIDHKSKLYRQMRRLIPSLCRENKKFTAT